MNKKLKKAIEKMEKRTGTILAFADYDRIDGGIQTMSDNSKYALWLCGILMDNNKQYMRIERVIARFRTQIEAINAINNKEFDEYIIPEI